MNLEDLNNDNLNFSDKEDGFSLPENYFDSFSSKLFKKIADDEELKDYPLLTYLYKTNPFITPVGYFEQAEDILQYPLLIENRTQPFITSTGYFDALSNNIINRISVEEEKITYPLLHSLKQKNTFAVPQQYFETFIVETDTKITPLYQRIKLSYKIAAAITLVIGLSVLFYTQKTKPVIINDCNTFACLDKKDILSSGYVLHVNDDNIIDLIDEKQLSDSLFLQKDGKTQKVEMNDVSDNVDINTLTVSDSIQLW